MRSSSSPRAVNITTGIGATSRSRRHTSMPSRPGSIRSRTTRSGSVDSAFASASSPSSAKDTCEPFTLEVAADDLGQRRVVVDHQHPRVLQVHVHVPQRTEQRTRPAAAGDQGFANRKPDPGTDR